MSGFVSGGTVDGRGVQFVFRLDDIHGLPCHRAGGDDVFAVEVLAATGDKYEDEGGKGEREECGMGAGVLGDGIAEGGYYPEGGGVESGEDEHADSDFLDEMEDMKNGVVVEPDVQHDEGDGNHHDEGYGYDTDVQQRMQNIEHYRVLRFRLLVEGIEEDGDDAQEGADTGSGRVVRGACGGLCSVFGVDGVHDKIPLLVLEGIVTHGVSGLIGCDVCAR